MDAGGFSAASRPEGPPKTSKERTPTLWERAGARAGVVRKTSLRAGGVDAAVASALFRALTDARRGAA